MRFRPLMVFLLAFWMIGALLVPATAHAAGFRLRVEDPTTGYGVVVTDEGIGDSGTGQPGIIMFSLTGLGGADTSLTIAQGRQAPYDPTALGDLYLNSVTITSTGPAKLLLTLEDTGYTGGSGWLKLTSHMVDTSPGFFDAPAGSTAKIYSGITAAAPPEFGLDSADPTTSSLLTPMIGATSASTTAVQTLTPGSALAADESVAFYATGSYSLYTQVMVDLTGAATLSFYQDANVVQGPAALDGPEPASLFLISTGLLGAVGARRRFMLNRG